MSNITNPYNIPLYQVVIMIASNKTKKIKNMWENDGIINFKSD